jgi:glucoamylase
MRRRCNIAGLGIACAAVVALVALAPVASQTSPLALVAGTASDGPGDAAAWTTGNKLAVGTSADTTSKVWFTVAKGKVFQIC